MASWRQWLVAGGLLLACACAQAAVRMQAATLSLPGIQLADVRLDAALGADGRPTLHVDAKQVSIPSLGWRDVGLSLAGEPQRADGGAWKFVGHIATRKAPGDALRDAAITILYDQAGGTLAVTITQGKSGIDAQMPLDQTSHVQMELTAIPLAWLRGVLAAAWPDGKLNGGTVAGDVALDLATGDTRVSGRVSVKGADLDSRGGTIATQKLNANGSFRIDTSPVAASVMFDGRLHGGQLLMGPLYAQLPSNPVGLHVAGNLGPGGIAIDSLDFDDPDALRLTGSLGFDRKGNLDRLDLKRFAATFPQAYTRYGTTLAQSLTGFKSLTTAGSISGALDFEDKGLRVLDLTARNLTLDSHGGSLAVAGLDGGIDWRSGVSRPATQLRWSALSIYKLVFGPANLALKDDGGTLNLRAPVSAGLYGGTFQLGRFAWRPDAGKSQRLSAAFAVTDVDVNQLCAALGWPAFGGKLGGAVPDMSYRGGNVVFAGGLSLNAFGGSVSVTHLAMQHLFGKRPVVVADIDLDQLDLAPLTGVFGFGQITGRLDGDIHGLKLVDWKPTAFNAVLTANGGGKISQNAIKSLTQVGGGGIAGGIQGMALRLFKTFGYSKIGLSCTLAHGVCSMGGINPDPDPDAGGYTIVEGSGLPRITVIGHERSVDWATLVSRLKAVTEGNAPIIK
ncbi:MAG: hypothetical protein EPN36_00865 [Rhodanobacteraceae bacterium]|nr:MAG: hypothetical protein EPN36_00865 [Rhodanobacteraceae bacterium]